jgi:choline dehydrogenase-like flavoprotein
MHHCEGTGGHSQGTNRMGPASDPRNVVDQRLRVHGVKGLRVVDVSIHPTPVHGNTNQPAVLVGLNAGRMILVRLSDLI